MKTNPSTSPAPSTINPQLSTTSFPRCLGESPRALCAFTTYFNLGPDRSLKTVAQLLDRSINTVKKWSTEFHWTDRILAFEAGLLQNQAQAQADSCQKQAADWTRRNTQFLEDQWDATQKLRAAAQCYLETVDEQQLAKMTLSQATRALQAATDLSRLALQDAKATCQQQPSAYNPAADAEFRANFEKVYGKNSPFAKAHPNLYPTSASSTPNQSA